MKSPFFIRFFLVLSVAAYCSCGPATDWEGKYASRQGDFISPVNLILKADGKGFWEHEGESTPLRWEKRKGALWLHIKAGGVLIATLEGGDKSLAVDVPGYGRILFEPQ